MIFKRDDEPGTPSYGRPYDDEEDAGTRGPDRPRTASAGPVAPAGAPAEGMRRARREAAPDAPDWSGARAGRVPGAPPERDEAPGRGPAADRPHRDEGATLVAGHQEPGGEAPDEAPHGTAPHGTAPHGTAPHDTARNDTAPHDTALNGTARKDTAPHDVTRPAGDEELIAPASGSPEAEGAVPAGRHAGTGGTGEPAHDTAHDTAHDMTDDLFGWDAGEVRRRWHEVQVAFVDDPRESVERADEMVEEVVSALSSRRQDLADGWKNLGQDDTERLRLALRDYRSLLERLTGPFQGTADRGVR